MQNNMMPQINMQQFQQFAQNPLQAFLRKGLDIPQNIGNDTNSIAQYLLNTGKVTQEQYNWAMQMGRNWAAQMGNQFNFYNY